MKIYKLNKLPDGYEYFEIAEFCEFDIMRIEEVGADVAFYWYGTCAYEGTGQILFRVNGKWHLHDASHCSCYGPTDHIRADDYFKSLAEIKERCSDELWEEIKPLVELAKSKGYK